MSKVGEGRSTSNTITLSKVGVKSRHWGILVRQSIEDTLNALPDVEADNWLTSAATSTRRKGGQNIY
ncbi:MAG: hypothetical protein WBI90_06270 [Acetomicrobium sp.]